MTKCKYSKVNKYRWSTTKVRFIVLLKLLGKKLIYFEKLKFGL